MQYHESAPVLLFLKSSLNLRPMNFALVRSLWFTQHIFIMDLISVWNLFYSWKCFDNEVDQILKKQQKKTKNTFVYTFHIISSFPLITQPLKTITCDLKLYPPSNEPMIHIHTNQHRKYACGETNGPAVTLDLLRIRKLAQIHFHITKGCWAVFITFISMILGLFATLSFLLEKHLYSFSAWKQNS